MDPAVHSVSRAHSAHAVDYTVLLERLATTSQGLGADEVAVRLARHGPNALPEPQPPGVLAVLLRQFLSPLIYVLLAAAVLSLLLREWADAGFICVVLLLNAVIGTVQEYHAQRSASALSKMITSRAEVFRDGQICEIDAVGLVPGDVVQLGVGARVPADIRLGQVAGLKIDESLLTGESAAVHKQADATLPADTPLAERTTMAYSGTMVTNGRAQGVVAATGIDTEVGQLAESLGAETAADPPLVLRMRRFTIGIATALGVIVLIMVAVELSRGAPWQQVFMIAVALAVSAIPEGLPVALTVALAIGMNRMARRHVIVRRLVAVEALGSCTVIASDKTGTLTHNELTVRVVQLPGQPALVVRGEGMVPNGEVVVPDSAPADTRARLERLCLAGILPNDGVLARRNGAWIHHGDTVDVALQVMAQKAGYSQAEALQRYPEQASIPYESEIGYAASLHDDNGRGLVFVKGALEVLLPMCRTMAVPGGDRPLEDGALLDAVEELGGAGYRVLALAEGAADPPHHGRFGPESLHGLRLLGLIGMLDPLRQEAREAVATCRDGGIRVCMITGDHPATSLAIARELGLAETADEVVTGRDLVRAEADGEDVLAALVDRALVFARVEPRQKLEIVQIMQRHGQFVAVTGDGANDAPALNAAHVGVAMGLRGTDVARESADLIITDDNFASIVAGTEEGRVAYQNIRKVILLLIATGAAEVVLFTLSLAAGMPLPLHAVQLLWLNLVTNGIQDVALAFEAPEGDEMQRRPRDPAEPIFNRLMIERVLVSAVVMGGVAFALFRTMLAAGWALEEARNVLLLLMVLFENVYVLNCRSELRSVFSHSPLLNPLLLFGTLAAQLIHIGAMYVPGLRDILHIAPVTFDHWLELLLLALSVLVVMELHKWHWRRREGSVRNAAAR